MTRSIATRVFPDVFQRLAKGCRTLFLVMTSLGLVGIGAQGLRAQQPGTVSPAPGVAPAADAPVDPEHAAKMKAGLELFQKDVRPVLVGRCVKCHGGDKTEGQFDLNTRETLLKTGESGPQVVAGKPLASRLMKLIAHEEEPSMPEDGAKLPPAQIAAIGRWIELGAPYDKPLVDKNVRPDAWIHKGIESQAREFWAFQPLRRVEPAATTLLGWNERLVDRFVAQQLQARKLQPNGPADRRLLVRRAYFDLIGLPPPPAVVESFAQDNDPQAFSKLVDRLLDDPHFGERWGRHWLDTTRFAESHGFEQDYDRPFAFHYRDFVIRALNDDLPFDKFVQWQIAGDELEPENPLALMATGFLGAGVFPTQLTEKEFETARYDELDDMVATFGTSMLGLTVGCARCHDHKYDPIPAADYYRLVANFSTAIRGNVELDLHSRENQEALAKWEREHQPLVEAVARYEKESLDARFDAWLKRRVAEGAGKTPAADAPATSDPTKNWLTLNLVSAVSKGGATLARQEDGSYLASGTNPDFDTYTLVAETHVASLRSLRLETLPHPSFVRGGPGRADNGNIALGTITVTAEPLDRSQPPAPVKLEKPRATFEQNSGGLSLAASLDNDPRSGWALDPQFGKPHAGAFEFATPVGFTSGTRLTVTLDFTVNNRHNIGRPRLAVTASSEPLPLDAPGQSQEQVEILSLVDRTRGELTPEQRQRVRSWYRTIDPEWRALQDKVAQHLAAKPQPKKTQVMIVSEGIKPIPHHADDRGFPHFYKETHFLKRGDVSQKQAVAQPDFLQVLTPPRAGDSPSLASLARWQATPPEGSKTSYRRRALAQWLVDTEQGAGRLLARVIVNRLWQHHFGRGLVSTPNDFGMQGQRPSHPELLDYLATELIRNQWRLKPIHRLLMNSAVYQQASQIDDADLAVDPENVWLWRYRPIRLEAEIIRDNMLAVSGELDATMFGPGSLDEGHKRRSIYFTIKRSRLIASMQIFDAPEPLVSIGGRPSTTIAPQAMHFLNSPQVRGYAKGFAKRLQPTLDKDGLEGAVRQAYLMALGRTPKADESRDDVDFVTRQAESYVTAAKAAGKSLEAAAARDAALTDFCQVLMSLNEFVYVE